MILSWTFLEPSGRSSSTSAARPCGRGGGATQRAWLVPRLHGAYDHGRMFDDLAPRLAGLGYHVVALIFGGTATAARSTRGSRGR